jgi:uncharacterized protein YegP (UPF0339 family)
MKLSHRRYSVLLLVIALDFNLQAQVSPPDAQISGRVIRADNSVPIEGAIVALSCWGFISGNPQTVKTDNNGEYHFQNLKSGNYSISASADGFVSAEYRRDASLDGGILTVDGTTRMREVDLSLIREAVIRGMVIDTERRPVGSGVFVAAVRWETRDNGLKRLSPVSIGYTNATGHFALKKLPAGKYFVCVDGPSGYEVHPDPGGWYKASWYGDTPTEKGALQVSLKEGGEQDGIQIKVERETRYKVIIWPSGLEPDPAAKSYDLNFSLLERDIVCMKQSDGSYVIPNIPAGHFTLVSEVWLRSKYGGRKETNFDIEDGDVTMHINLEGLGEIENTVK